MNNLDERGILLVALDFWISNPFESVDELMS